MNLLHRPGLAAAGAAGAGAAAGGLTSLSSACTGEGPAVLLNPLAETALGPFSVRKRMPLPQTAGLRSGAPRRPRRARARLIACETALNPRSRS